MQHCGRGLTLIELIIGIAVVAVLATLAAPPLTDRAARQRLASAAEMLAMDLAEARLEAVASAQALHLVFGSGAAWCWAVARSTGCGCETANPCQLKREHAEDWPGLDLQATQNIGFDAVGMPTGGAQVRLGGVGGAHGLTLSLTPMGRVKVCTETALPGYTPC